MHIYVFGSVCRGEIDTSSDVDMLAIYSGRKSRFNPNDYSIYSYTRIRELWIQGNPFAWHLYLESKLVYTSDNVDFLKDIGQPNKYIDGLKDLKKFQEIFLTSKKSVEESNLTETFDLSSIFMAIRNMSTCYTLHVGVQPNFSRNSARHLGDCSVPLDDSVYDIFKRARVLCTRGVGDTLKINEICMAKEVLGKIESWMKKIINKEGYDYERI